MEKNIHSWIVAVLIFLAGRALFSDFFHEGTVIGGMVYVFFLWAYVFPYLSGKTILLVPGHKLVKGEDDWSRAIFFVLGLSVCISAMIGGVPSNGQ